MHLVRFNPFRELTGMDRLLNDTFDRFFEDTDT